MVRHQNHTLLLALVCVVAFLIQSNESLIPIWGTATTKTTSKCTNNNGSYFCRTIESTHAKPGALCRPRKSLITVSSSSGGGDDKVVFFADMEESDQEKREKEEAARKEKMALEAIRAAEAQLAGKKPADDQTVFEMVSDEELKKAEESAEKERIEAEKVRQAKLEEEVQLMEEEREKSWKELTENVSGKAGETYEKILKPMVQIQDGVSPDRIKGAAIAAAAVTFLATKGVVASGAVGLSAAYLSISKSMAGDVLRTVGGITSEATESASKLTKQLGFDLNPKLASKFGEVDKTVVNKYKRRPYVPSPKPPTTAAPDDIELAYIEAEDDEDLARVLKEAEDVISEADAAIAKAEAEQREKEKTEKHEEVVPHEEEEVEEDDVEVVAEVEEDNDKEIVTETNDEEDEDEEVVAEDELWESEEDESEEENDEEDDDEVFFDDDEFMAAVELAQEGLEGKIVGVDEIITDNSAKAEWDAAGILASELRQDSDATVSTPELEEDDDDDFDFEEIDLEALGRAARLAVEAFETEEEESDKTVLDQKQEWADSMVEEDEDDDVDFEDDDDFFAAAGGDLDAIAAAARAAVEASATETLEEPDDDVAGSSLTDWSSFKVAELKTELKKRGLKTTGKKADLVSLLEEDDMKMLNQVDDNEEKPILEDDEDVDLEDFDIEELGRQARAAVEMFQTTGGDFDEEPTEEMLAQLESEMAINGDFLVDEPEESVDISKMTVAQLKDECRRRGLKVGGKKADLVERLQTSLD